MPTQIRSATGSDVGALPPLSPNAVQNQQTMTPIAADAPSTIQAVDPTFVASDSYPCLPGQIKGNARTNIYHLPDGMYYSVTRNDRVVCFDTPDAAIEAGFRASKR
jgi:hypothetical protein